MSGINFEGDIQSFNEKQLDLITDILQKLGIENAEVVVEPVGKVGDNFVALVKRIIVKVKDVVLLKLIAKVAPTNEVVRSTMQTSILFNNEIVMYSEVFPKFNDILKSENIPTDKTVRLPVCYGFLADPPNEIIVLEDLKQNDYEILDRMKPLQKEVIDIVLKDLAIFHSLSYALRVKYPEIYSGFTTKLVNFWSILDTLEQSRTWLEEIENDIISMLENENDKKIVKESLTKMPSRCHKQHEHDMESRHSVILQGDCWTNNLMFKLKDTKPVGVVMIDYQLSKVASPVADVLYLMFNCTDHETRSKHYKEWINLYHSELGKSLNNFGLEAKNVYSREQLDADLRTHGKITLGLSLLLANMLCRESEDIFDIKEFNLENADIEEKLDSFKIQNSKEKTVERIKNRAKDSIDSVVQFGIIV